MATKKAAGVPKVHDDGAGGFVGEATGGKKGKAGAAGAVGTADSPQNMSFPSWSDITDTLKQIKGLLDVLVGVLGALPRANSTTDPNNPTPDNVPPLHDAGATVPVPPANGKTHLVSENGTIGWEEV